MAKGGKQRQAAKAASQERKNQALSESVPESQTPATEPSPAPETTAEVQEASTAAMPAASDAVDESVSKQEGSTEKTLEDEGVQVSSETGTSPAQPLHDDEAGPPLAAEAPKAESRPDVLERMTAEERETELRSQVTGLNAKLVDSINRMSDLEDELSVAHNRILVHTTRIAELSKERDQYISAMNTGLLVEKAHVTSEMQRMMERVVEETAQRGKAESDKTRIEAELEELSAALFNEANSMVAVERLARAKAEEKSQQLEVSLRDTERVMQDQQEMLKNLQAEVDAVRVHAPDASPIIAAAAPPAPAPQPTITVNIPPYVEFLQFLSHLRSMHDQLAPYFDMQRRGVDWTTLAPLSASLTAGGVSSPSINPSGSVVRHRDYPHLPMSAENLVQLSSQTTLPFIRRTLEEDADPCLRLSHAPGLNWLTRRQATSAIMDGDVVIEPLFPGGEIPDEAALRAEYGSLPPASCSLSNVPLLNVSALLPGASASSTWSIPLKDSQGRRSLPSIFQSLRRGLDRSQSGTQSERFLEVKEGDEIFSQDPEPPMRAETLPIPTHYFRLSDQATSRHLVSHHCLQRLRVVCAFWTFVRTLERAIVLEGKVEPEYVGQTRILPASAPPCPPRSASAGAAAVSVADEASEEPPKESKEPEEKEAKEADADAETTQETKEVDAEAKGADTDAEAKGADADAKEAETKQSNKAETTDAEIPTDVEDERDDLEVFNEALEDHTEADPLDGAQPPALPARPSQIAPSRDTFTAQTDRSSLSWEESLWAEVIRYKELMWKARVGVDLARLDIV
ncbi:hypothetical protein MCAP1_001536 [Malassezia caprae]|uniref:GDP/GTP exchange factor Sec2 N-terminal domain-containing protein n=1 Tax=Malassezia caprae TaxID=1381934 RepID=A0AAF0IV45_9BASI|nr:hypothetical protein MCAP1_001536 [Malassezia caprae]